MRSTALLAIAGIVTALAATTLAPTAVALPQCYQVGSHSGPVYLDFHVCATQGRVGLVFCTQVVDHIDPPFPDIDRCYVNLG